MGDSITNIDLVVSVVDDDRAARDSVCAVIESAGYRTAAYESGETFLNRSDLTHPGCLVIDYRLPGLSGLEIQDKLRRDRVRIPVILISGFADVPIAVKAMQQGAVTLLQKPYSQEDLLNAVTRAFELDEHRRREEQLAEDARIRLDGLNEKEREVLRQMLEGKSNRTVAQSLNIGLRTVERRRHDIFSKTKVDSEVKLAELVKLASFGRRASSVNGD
jgi:FixJ family two-component response regulator